jgi:diguanylate cyclase (GGDEF)-like protein
MGFRSLRFMKELEGQFLQHYLDHNPGQIKRALPIAFVLTFLFALTTYQRLPLDVFNALILPRAAQFLALGALAIVVYRDSRKLIEPAVSLTLLVYGISTPIMLGIITSSGHYAPIGALLLILIFCYLLSGLRFFRATLVALVITLAYPTSQLLFSAPLPNLTFNCYILLVFNITGLSGAYFLEYTARENYLSGRLLHEIALFDGLTGLLNRRAFALDLERICRQALRQQAGLAVAMVDVDHFKEYNDYFGHQMGDDCLREIAEALAGTIKRPLDKVGRYGGEEFILAWFDCDEQGARDLGEVTRKAIEDLAIAQGPRATQSQVTISVGVGFCAAGERCFSGDMIRIADRALYRAKHNGRNRVEVDTDPNDTSAPTT